MITWEEWLETYRPMQDANGYPRAFDTHGKEGEWIRKSDPSLIWTVVDTPEGAVIVAGRRHVDRLAYHVATVPRTTPEEETIEVLD
jgi:hypothetical protein